MAEIDLGLLPVAAGDTIWADINDFAARFGDEQYKIRFLREIGCWQLLCRERNEVKNNGRNR